MLDYIEVDSGTGISVWVPSQNPFSDWYAQGDYEKEVTERISEILSEGDGVCDVGAHVGYHTFRCARKVGENGHVFAFEPDPQAVYLLKKGIAGNDCKNVTVEPLAIGADSCDTELYFTKSGLTSAIPPQERKDELFGEQTPTKAGVRCTTLDRYFASRPIPRLVKIDVEGAEWNVLQGMGHMLESSSPFLIIDLHGEDNERIVELLKQLNYEIHLVRAVADDPAEPKEITSRSDISTFTEATLCGYPA